MSDKDLKDVGSMMSESLKKSLGTKAGLLGISLTSIFAAYKAFKAIDSKFGLTYNGAYGNTSKSLKSVQDTKSEVDDLQSKVDGYKESLQQIATNNDIDVSDLESVDAIVQKINSVGGISLVDQAEVQKIQVANTQLKGTLKNKQNILSQEQKEAAVDAEKNLKKKVNPNVKKSKDGTYEYVGTNGVAAGTGAEHQNVIDATAQDLKGYQEYSDKIAKLREKQSKATSTSESKAIEKQIKEAETAKDKIGNSLDSRQEELSTMMKALSVNGEGVKALSEHGESFNSLKSIVNAISDKDLTGVEKTLSVLNSYFDGSTGSNAIKDQLQSAVDSGQDLEVVLSRMGLSLDDLGIDKISQLQDYLENASESASATANSINDIDGSVTSVTDAFKEANQDDDWNTMSDDLEKANKLYEKGKVGTDDFQQSAQFLTYGKINPDSTKYDADAYSKAWEKAEEKRKRYFDADNPNDSKNNFIDDLKAKGLATEKNGDITWTKQFTTSAKAAEKLGISVSAVETLMSNLQSYGAEFDGIEWSSENLDSFKESLSGLKNIYDSLSDENSAKEKVGDAISNWDSEVKGYEDDMNKLTKDKVVKIKFQYDLAGLQQKIDELTKDAQNGGDSKTWTSLNSATQTYIEESEKASGNKIKQNKNYKKADSTVKALQDQYSKATTESQKVALGEQINNILNAQKEINDAYTYSNKSYDEFKRSAEYKKLNKALATTSKESKQQVANVLGIEESSIKEDKQKTKKVTGKNGTKGNVDLTNRPKIASEKLMEAGWTDAGKGGTATVYSSGYSTEDGKKTVVVTPILPNGSVLSPDQLQNYANDLLAGKKDTSNLGIRTYVGDDSIERSDRYAESLHSVQDAYYLGDDKQKKSLSSLKEYNAEQLKALNLNDKSANQMEKSFTSLMKTLDISKSAKNEFVDALSDMGLLSTKSKSSKKKDKDDDKSKNKTTSDKSKSSKSDDKKSLNKKTVEEKVVCKVDKSELDKLDKDISSKDAKKKVVELIGKDEATPIVDKWNNMEAPDKHSTLSGKDQATAVVTLWNSMNASDKFSKLTAEDRATTLVAIWNGLSAQEKTAIINGDSSVADKVIASVQAKVINDKNFTITAKDNATGTISSIRSEISSVTGKTVTITTVHNEKTVKSTEYKSGGSQRFSSNGHKSHVNKQFNGTFHPSVPAKAQGTLNSSSVGIPKSEKTLINEVGAEGVVRDGKLNIYNNGYPALVDLKKNDIVFNHKQMEELEKKGYITNSHAKIVGGTSAFATGTVDDLNDVLDNDYLDDITAYAHGSLGGISARARGMRRDSGGLSSNSNNSKNTNKSTTPSKSKSNSDKSKKKKKKKGKSTAKKFQDWLDKFFDWIEVRLKKLQTQTERFEKKAENSRTLKGTTSNYENAYKNTNKEISVNKKGATRYQKQANTVKKQAVKRKIVKPKQANNLIKKIKNGTININAYSEKVQNFIKGYQEYWDKAEECRTNQLDLQKQLYELEQKKLDSITDYYDTLGNLYKSEQEIYSSSNDLIKSNGGSEGANSTYYKNLLSQRSKQAAQTSTLQQEKNAYAKELKTAKNRFGSNSNEAREVQIKYNEIIKELNDSKTAYEDLNSQIREVTYNLSQWAIDKWSGVADRLSAAASLFKVKDTSNETRRKNLEKIYTNQKTANNNTIVYYEKLRNDKIMERDKYDKSSTKWNELNSEVSDLDVKILGLASDNEELNDSIQELRFEPFEKMNESIDNNISDMEHLIDLMGDAETVSEDGVITDAGNAQILLKAEEINQAQEAISNYEKEMAGLETMYKNGQMSQEDYESKQREIIENQQKEASVVKDSRNAILQIYKDSLQKENDLLQKNITKRKEALKAKQDFYNYNKTLQQKNKDITTLQNEIAALEGTASAAGKARLEELKAQLKDAQDDYNDTVKDHENDVRDEGYDKIAEDASDALDKTLKALDSNSKMQTDVVNKMLDGMVESYDEAYAKIRDIIKSSGTAVSDATEKATSQTKEELNTTVTNVKNGSTSSNLGNMDTSTIKGGANESKANKATEEVAKQASKPEPTLTQEGQDRKKASDAKAKQDAKTQGKADEQKQKNIANLESKLESANVAYQKAWNKTENHYEKMKKSHYWNFFTDSKKKKVKAHKTVSINGLQKDKGLGAAQNHNDFVKKEQEAKSTAQDYVNQLKKLGKTTSVIKPGKNLISSTLTAKVKGYATGGITDELVPANDITQAIPALRHVITANGDEGLITARLGEMILPEKPVKNLVPDFISNVEKANEILKGGDSSDVHIENNLIVQGSIDKDTFPGVKKMQEMSYDYIVKQLTDQRQKSGCKTKL